MSCCVVIPNKDEIFNFRCDLYDNYLVLLEGGLHTKRDLTIPLTKNVKDDLTTKVCDELIYFSNAIKNPSFFSNGTYNAKNFCLIDIRNFSSCDDEKLIYQKLQTIIFVGRHFNTTTIIISDSIKFIPPYIKTNVNVFYVGSQRKTDIVILPKILRIDENGKQLLLEPREGCGYFIFSAKDGRLIFSPVLQM